MTARMLRRAGLGARGVSRPRDLAPVARVEPLEQRRLLAATPFVEAGGGTFEGGTLNFNVGVRVGYGERVAAEQRFTVGVTIGGEAMPGFDYVEPTSLSVTVVLPSYGMSATAPLSILTLRDNRVEDGETLIVKATSISGPNAGAITDPPPRATGWIGDDPPRISIEGSTQVNESDGRVFLTARRSGGDMTKGISGVIETSGPAIRGEDYNVPGGVTFAPNECVANVEVTLLDDTAIEAPVGVAGWSENAIIAIGDGGNGYVATGTPVTVAIGDDAQWFQDRQWEVYDGLPDIAPQTVGQVVTYAEFEGDEFRTTKTYVIYESWRPLGIEDESDNWGEAVDLSFSVTHEQTVDVGVEAGIEMLKGVHVSVGVNVALSTAAEADESYAVGGAEDTKFRIKAFIRHREVVEYEEKFRRWNGGPWQFYDNQRRVIREGDVLGNYDAELSKKQRYWLDPEAVGNRDLIGL